jgi:alpha-1,3-rhamnosyl/mannosyltransferase
VRVGVDATCWDNPRGFGRFARNAVGRLVELDPDTTYVLYTDRNVGASLDLPPTAEHRPVDLRSPVSATLAAGAGRGIGDVLRLIRAAARRDLDAFLFPSVLGYFPVIGVPCVVGLHDATSVEHPGLVFASWRARLLWRAKERSALRRATRLFTVSESARRAIAERFGVPEAHLDVIGEAPAPIFFPRDRERRALALAPLGLAADEDFVLCAGGVNPHKNVGTLVRAYAQLRRAGNEVPRLVIAGALEGEYVSAGRAMRELVSRLDLAEHVLLTGFVSDEALACLYGAATAVVIPSLAEGFGLPAVEAAACGAPVVLSDIAAHHEALADGALYFAATDAQALAGRLDRVLADGALRRDIAHRGHEVVSRLSWDDTAARLRALIGDIIGSAPAR